MELFEGENVEDVRLSSYWDRVDQSSFHPVQQFIIYHFHFEHSPWLHSIFFFFNKFV